MAQSPPYGLERVAVFSTGHMPSASPDWGSFPATTIRCAYGAGFVLFCGWSDGDDIPDWLKPLSAYANQHSSTLILFDPDGVVFPEFTTYEW